MNGPVVPSGPRVSVVVATNRQSPYLAAALESARDQTRPYAELVVVDDGCPDPVSLRACVERFPRSRVVSAPGNNVSVGRNLGVAATSGDLLAFLDDDDLWRPDRLEQMVAAFVARPDAVAGYSGLESIDADGTVLDTMRPGLADRRQIVRREVSILVPNLMVWRSAFVAVGGFDPTRRYAEDLDLVLRLARLGPFCHVEEPLIGYRTHPDNATRRFQELAEGIRDVLQVHRAEAGRSEPGLVKDYDDSLRRNRRYAGWSVVRRLGEHRRRRAWRAQAGELWWLARFAPDLPILVARNRLHRLHRLKPRLVSASGRPGDLSY